MYILKKLDLSLLKTDFTVNIYILISIYRAGYLLFKILKWVRVCALNRREVEHRNHAFVHDVPKYLQ